MSPPFGSTPDVPGSLTFKSFDLIEVDDTFGIAVIDTMPLGTPTAPATWRS